VPGALPQAPFPPIHVKLGAVKSERGTSFDMQKHLPIVLVIAFAWCGLSEAADDGLEVVV
jgi:hypothetical protein